MGSETLDEILDQCLAMADAGASIEDCVALHPQHAGELRSHLELIGIIRQVRPDIPENVPGQTTGRARLLAAVGEQANERSRSPALGVFVPVQWALAYAGRLALPRALPAALIILLLTGSTLGALAATDTGGVRSAVTDVILPTRSDDDIIDDDAGLVPDGVGGGSKEPDGPALPGGLDLPEAPSTPQQPTDTPMSPTATPASPAQTPAVPTDTPARPPDTPADPTFTPAGPAQTPAVPTDTPAEPSFTPARPPDTPTDITDAGPTGEERRPTSLEADADQPRSADLPSSPT